MVDGPSRSVCECLGDFDETVFTATILYIKTSLTYEEPADIMAYKLKHSSFPHDSSAEHQETEIR
jgi:hypothetical protein